MDKETLATGSGEPPESLVKALRLVLLALVRLLMHFRVVYPQLTELLKSTYVEVAENEFRLSDKPQTDTRINLLTGIHRKDIKRLRSQLSSGIEEPLGVSQGVRIVSRWLSETQYQNLDGTPRPLPLKSEDGADFETLVKDVCRQDLRPRVILDEWLHLNIVEQDQQGLLHLNADGFVPAQGMDEKSFFLGMNVSDHIHASTRNLLESPSPFFERCVYYDGLSRESVHELDQYSRTVGMETLTKINEKAAQLKARDKKNKDGKQRVNIGLYVFHEEASNSSQDKTQ